MPKWVAKPETATVSITEPRSGIATFGVRENVAEVKLGASGIVVNPSENELRLPATAVESSVIASVHVPLGFSPRKALRRPSAAGGFALERLQSGARRRGDRGIGI